MKIEEVTVVNIDDYIRNEKTHGRFDISWNKNGWNVLKLFKPKIKSGDKYLGATHYEKD